MLPVLDGLEKEKYANFMNMRQVNHLFVFRCFAQKPYICEKYMRKTDIGFMVRMVHDPYGTQSGRRWFGTMDIYRLIESRAVKDYLKGIHYQFNSVECAMLILSNMTMTAKEKEAALADLMASMPDMALTENKSLFSAIQEYLGLQKKTIQDFYSPAEDEVYYVTVHSDFDRYAGNPLKSICKSMDECLRFAKQTNPKQIKIKKGRLGSAAVAAELVLNAQQEPLRLIDWAPSGNLQKIFTDLRQSPDLKIPLPFRAGDIVYLPSSVQGKPPEPMVIDGKPDIPPFDWVHANGVFKASSRGITLDFLPEFERFEYYTDELKGRDRILKPVSHFLKRDIRNLEVFITAILKIHGEEQIGRDDIEYLQDLYEEANFVF